MHEKKRIRYETGSDTGACDEPGCDRVGTSCTVLNSHQVRLCPGHAQQRGFCWSCGRFIAGSGEQEHHDGACRECWEDYNPNSLWPEK